MLSSHRPSARLWLLIVFLSLVPLGCSTLGMSGYTGKRIQPNALIPLQAGQPVSGVYRTDELQVDYQYQLQGQTLMLSGTLHFLSSLQRGFSTVQRFSLGVALTGTDDRILGAYELTGAGYALSEDPMGFAERIPLPAPVRGMAFYYSGRAVDGGGFRRDANGRIDMNFWSLPFENPPAP